MTYQEKMAQAIEKAEAWQAEVEQYEAAAETEAMDIIRDKRRPKDKARPVVLGPVLIAHIKETLRNDTMYHRAVGNRNAQQTLAQMYGTAALVAAQYGTGA
jgi:regulator of protease activity HflC (stomatin/prohibitin superfamily)